MRHGSYIHAKSNEIKYIGIHYNAIIIQYNTITNLWWTRDSATNISSSLVDDKEGDAINLRWLIDRGLRWGLKWCSGGLRRNGGLKRRKVGLKRREGELKRRDGGLKWRCGLTRRGGGGKMPYLRDGLYLWWDLGGETYLRRLALFRAGLNRWDTILPLQLKNIGKQMDFKGCKTTPIKEKNVLHCINNCHYQQNEQSWKLHNTTHKNTWS